MANVVTIELPEELAQQLHASDDGVTDALGKLALNTFDKLATLIQSLQNEDPYIRAEAAKELGDMRAETAIQSLVEALRDSDRLARYSAATALQSIGTPEALRLLQEESTVSEDLLPLLDPDYGPLLALAGSLDIGTTDLGENHDYYIAQVLETEMLSDE